MVDRGIFDGVSNILETQDLKHGTNRICSIPKLFFLEAIWWHIWVSDEKYYQILYIVISVAQMIKKLPF